MKKISTRIMLFLLGYYLFFQELIAPVVLNASFVPTNSYLIIFYILISFFVSALFLRKKTALSSLFVGNYNGLLIFSFSLVAFGLTMINTSNIYSRLLFVIPFIMITSNVIYLISRDNTFICIFMYSLGMVAAAVSTNTLLLKLGPINAIAWVGGILCGVSVIGKNKKHVFFQGVVVIALLILKQYSGEFYYTHSFAWNMYLTVALLIGCLFLLAYDYKSVITLCMTLLLLSYYPIDIQYNSSFYRQKDAEMCWTNYIKRNIPFLKKIFSLPGKQLYHKEDMSYADIDYLVNKYPDLFYVYRDKWNFLGRTTTVSMPFFLKKEDYRLDLKEFYIDRETESFEQIKSKYFNNIQIYQNKIPWYSLNRMVKKDWIDFLKEAGLEVKDILEIGSGCFTNTYYLKELYPKARIDALEFNEVIVDLLKMFKSSNFYKIFAPNQSLIRLIVKEGRNYLSEINKTYDLIVLDFADTMQFTPVLPCFSESYLYTEEAFKVYWNHLNDDGFMVIGSHIDTLSNKKPFHLLKMLVTLLSSLDYLGDLKNHILVFQNRDIPSFGYIFLFKKPIKSHLAVGDYPVLYPKKSSAENNLFSEYLEGNLLERRKLVDNYPLNISPIVDQKPFLHNKYKASVLFCYSVCFFGLLLMYIVCLIFMFGEFQKQLIKKKYLWIVLLIYSITSSFSLIYFLNELFLKVGSPFWAISIGLSSYYFSYGVGAFYHSWRKLKVSLVLVLISFSIYFFMTRLSVLLVVLNLSGFLFGMIFSQFVYFGHSDSFESEMDIWIWSSLFAAITLVVAYLVFLFFGSHYNLLVGLAGLIGLMVTVFTFSKNPLDYSG